MEKAQTTTQKRKMPWDDDPRLGRYIDDNALFVLDSMARGHLVGKNASHFFFLASLHSLEWDHKTLIKFLIRIAEEYGIELKNFTTMTYAFSEEYEKDLFDPKTNQVFPDYEEEFKKYSDELNQFEKYKKEHGFTDDDLFPVRGKSILVPPRQLVHYEGAYKWALDEIKKKPQSSDGKLLSKIFADKFDLADLKEAIKISDRMLPINEPEDSEQFMAKRICNDIVDWASFEVEPEKQTFEVLRKDMDDYLEKFINNALKIGPTEKRVGKILVLQNPNIYTFNKHRELFFKRFQTMQENYGDTFSFENPFDQIPIPFEFEKGNEESIRLRYAARQFLFIHTVFAFEKLGYIKVLSLGNNWHWSEQVTDLRDVTKIQLLPPFFKELGVEPKRTNLYFDDDKSRLYIRGIEIKIQKNSDQYHALRVMFADQKELAQEWFFDDIAERIDRSRPQERVKRYYNAIYQVGLKLMAKGFPDFFITTKYAAKIDPKRLS